MMEVSIQNSGPVTLEIESSARLICNEKYNNTEDESVF